MLAHDVLTLNPRRFRAAQARALGLGIVARLGWAKERRIVQALRLEAPGGRTYLVANMHCTSFAADERLADAELLRAAWFAVSTAAPEDVVVLAGDFNARAAAVALAARPDRRRSGASRTRGPASTTSSSAAPRRARCGGGPTTSAGTTTRLLSDHAPVELEIS